MLETFGAIALVQAFGIDMLAGTACVWVADKWRLAAITNHDLQKALRKSYSETLSSIEFGLRQKEGLLDFVGKRRLQREITDEFDNAFLLPFSASKKLSQAEFSELAKKGANYCKALSKKVDQVLPIDEVSDLDIEDLLLTGRKLRGANDLSQLGQKAKDDLMARVRRVEGIPELFFELLEFKDLLVWSVVFFFGEAIKSDERVRSILNHNELQRIREEQAKQHQAQIQVIEAAFNKQLAIFEQSLKPIKDNLPEVLECLDRLEAEITQVSSYLERLICLVENDQNLSAKERKQLQAGISPSFDLASKYDFDPKRTLGYGAVAAVYKAQHKGLKQERAVKVLKPEYKNDADVVERFLREGAVLSNLEHPNIVQIFDAGGGGPGLDFYIEMEFIEGNTLRNYIKTREFDWPLILKLIKQSASAIQKMHESGIIHRDINPRNIMVDKDGDIKVMDFGVAKIIGMEGLTRDGQVIGTLDYMAPEQARGERVDERVDIFAFGVVIYELCTKHLPARSPLPLRQYEVKTPEWLEPIISKCLAEERSERYSSMRDVISAIEKGEESAKLKIKCHLHPQKVAVTKCSECGRDICQDCLVTFKDNPYCQKCIKSNLVSTRCTACGAQLREWAKFCPKCGEVTTKPTEIIHAPEARLCYDCGGKIKPEAKFCPKCGADLVKAK